MNTYRDTNYGADPTDVVRYLGATEGRDVIGTFEYRTTPSDDAVAVELSWAIAGGCVGRIRLCPHLQQALAASPDYPRDDIFPIEAAISYGMFLAMKLRASLIICGDASAWNPDWGLLRGEPLSLASARNPAGAYH